MNEDTLSQEIHDLNLLVEKMHTVLQGLSQRHEWQPNMGPCVCQWHTESRALLNELQNRSKLTDWKEYIPSSNRGVWRRVGNSIEIKVKVP